MAWQTSVKRGANKEARNNSGKGALQPGRANSTQVEDHLRSLKRLKEEQERIKAERESQVLSYM